MNDTTVESKYDICKKCGKPAVHLAMSGGITFLGDQDDETGAESEYMGQEVYTDVVVGTHACMECGEIEDVWIESPHHGDDERILNWLQEQWGQRLGIGPAHELAARVHLGEDLRGVAKELMRGEG